MFDWDESEFLSLGLIHETVEFISMFRNTNMSIEVPTQLVSSVLSIFTYGAIADYNDDRNNIVDITNSYMYDDKKYDILITDEIHTALNTAKITDNVNVGQYIKEAIIKVSKDYMLSLRQYWRDMFFINEGTIIDEEIYFSKYCFYCISPVDTIIVRRI